jgi:hypothetical protein
MRDFVSSNIKEGTIPCKSLRSKQIYFLQLVRKHTSLANSYCPECRRETGFKWHGFRELHVEVDERFVGTDRVALLKPQPRTSWERASARLTIPAFYPVYVRGEAYLAGGQGAPAAGKFQKILDGRGLVQNGPTAALANFGLARS